MGDPTRYGVAPGSAVGAPGSGPGPSGPGQHHEQHRRPDDHAQRSCPAGAGAERADPTPARRGRRRVRRQRPSSGSVIRTTRTGSSAAAAPASRTASSTPIATTSRPADQRHDPAVPDEEPHAPLRPVVERGDQDERDPQPQRVPEQQHRARQPAGLAARADARRPSSARRRGTPRCTASSRSAKIDPERERAREARSGPRPAGCRAARRRHRHRRPPARAPCPPVVVARPADAPASSGRHVRSRNPTRRIPARLRPITIRITPPMIRSGCM